MLVRLKKMMGGILTSGTLQILQTSFMYGPTQRMDIHIVRVTCDALISIADGDGYVRGGGGKRRRPPMLAVLLLRTGIESKTYRESLKGGLQVV